MLILHLDGESMLASAGSACTNGALEPSRVPQALGLDWETASAAVRFFLGAHTTKEEIDYAMNTLGTILRRMRESRDSLRRTLRMALGRSEGDIDAAIFLTVFVEARFFPVAWFIESAQLASS